MVRRLAELGAGQGGERGRDPRAELGVGVQAGADGRAADRQLAQSGQRRRDAVDAELDLAGVAAETPGPAGSAPRPSGASARS